MGSSIFCRLDSEIYWEIKKVQKKNSHLGLTFAQASRLYFDMKKKTRDIAGDLDLPNL